MRAIRRSGGLAAGPGLGGAEPVAVGAGLEDVGVEGDAVDDGGDEPGVGDDGAPFAEGQVAGQGDAGFLFAFGEDLEQQLGAAGVELDVAELVDLCRRRHNSMTSRCSPSTPSTLRTSNELIVERHRAATVVTSNRELIEWVGLTADPAPSPIRHRPAPIRRPRAVLDGESYRQRQKPRVTHANDERLDQPPAPRQSARPTDIDTPRTWSMRLAHRWSHRAGAGQPGRVAAAQALPRRCPGAARIMDRWPPGTPRCGLGFPGSSQLRV